MARLRKKSARCTKKEKKDFSRERKEVRRDEKITKENSSEKKESYGDGLSKIEASDWKRTTEKFGRELGYYTPFDQVTIYATEHFEHVANRRMPLGLAN